MYCVGTYVSILLSAAARAFTTGSDICGAVSGSPSSGNTSFLFSSIVNLLYVNCIESMVI